MEENQNDKSKGKDEAPPPLAPSDPAGENESGGAVPAPAQGRPRGSLNRQPFPSRPQAACVYNQLLLATLDLLASRQYFASTYVPLLLFLKMDLNRDASRNEDKVRIIIEESKKVQFGGKCNNFDEVGEGQEVSYVNYCRYNFLIKSGGERQPILFCFLLY